MEEGYCLFDTAIGRCGVVWRDRSISGTQLPGHNDDALRAEISRRHPDAQEREPPDFAQQTIDLITSLIAGEPADLSIIALDMAGVPAFHRKVYALARTIPPGQTMTYGEVAVALGSPGSARAVGQALGHNPFVIVVPCHRVIAAGGKSGGFSAHGGVGTKLRLLSIERGDDLFDAL